jgi:hypothetical protein
MRTRAAFLTLLTAAVTLAVSATAAATTKEYVLKHPKNEHCKAQYVKKSKTVHRKVHGHAVTVRETVCVLSTPGKPPTSPSSKSAKPEECTPLVSGTGPVGETHLYAYQVILGCERANSARSRFDEQGDHRRECHRENWFRVHIHVHAAVEHLVLVHWCQCSDPAERRSCTARFLQIRAASLRRHRARVSHDYDRGRGLQREDRGSPRRLLKDDGPVGSKPGLLPIPRRIPPHRAQPTAGLLV